MYSASPSDKTPFDASDIQDIVPSGTLTLSPGSATSVAAAANSFIASVTAAPEYSSVLSVLATGIPATAQAAIANAPEDYILDILGDCITPSVEEYFQSIGEDAARIITAEFGGLYTSVSSEVADAIETGGFALPTEGAYGTGNSTQPGPTATGADPITNPVPFEGAASRSISSIVAAVAAAGIALAHKATSTTVEPVFTYPADGTSTVYARTTTETSSLDCSGSFLVVSTFPVSDIGPGESTNTATVTSPITTSSEFSCLPSTSMSMNVSTTAIPPLNTPTAVPPPPINQSAQTLIDELRTAILYASLIANGGNQADICGGINPVSLSNNTGLKGVIVQNEVCATAAIQRFRPALGEALFLSNQIGLTYLTIALFAVQVVSGTFILILK
ncbi:MAG: hypothetical protein Q9177_004297 [Variospora cf. flavescens]